MARVLVVLDLRTYQIFRNFGWLQRFGIDAAWR